MSIRRIEKIACETGQVVAKEHGPVPELRWLKIAELVVDDTYQRPITIQGLKTIRSIVAAFDWRMFAPVVVCPVPGCHFAIVDGQHRVTAAATCGIESVPALVIQADRVEQAKAFGAINGRVTKINAPSLYKARLAAGEADALHLQAVTSAAGVNLLTYNPCWKTMKPGQTTAFQALKNALAKQGAARLETCLKALVASAGDRTGVIVTVTIGAFVNVLCDHRDYRRHPDLIAFAAKFPLQRKLDLAIQEATSKRMPRQPILEAMLVTHFETCIGGIGRQRMVTPSKVA